MKNNTFKDSISEFEGIKRTLLTMVKIVKKDTQISLTSETTLKIIVNEDNDDIIEFIVMFNGEALKSFVLAEKLKSNIRCVCYRNVSMALIGLCGVTFDDVYSAYKKLVNDNKGIS